MRLSTGHLWGGVLVGFFYRMFFYIFNINALSFQVIKDQGLHPQNVQSLSPVKLYWDSRANGYELKKSYIEAMGSITWWCQAKISNEWVSGSTSHYGNSENHTFFSQMKSEFNFKFSKHVLR